LRTNQPVLVYDELTMKIVHEADTDWLINSEFGHDDSPLFEGSAKASIISQTS